MINNYVKKGIYRTPQPQPHTDSDGTVWGLEYEQNTKLRGLRSQHSVCLLLFPPMTAINASWCHFLGQKISKFVFIFHYCF